jgi:hypothetical protein
VHLLDLRATVDNSLHGVMASMAMVPSSLASL